MIIYLYIFHENSLLTLEIICLISTLYIIIYLTSLHCFYYVVFNVGYRQYQSHAIINYLSIYLCYKIKYRVRNMFTFQLTQQENDVNYITKACVSFNDM